jgi:hypothetical protein
VIENLAILIGAKKGGISTKAFIPIPFNRIDMV